jgi:hypothetical protein
VHVHERSAVGGRKWSLAQTTESQPAQDPFHGSVSWVYLMSDTGRTHCHFWQARCSGSQRICARPLPPPPGHIAADNAARRSLRPECVRRVELSVGWHPPGPTGPNSLANTGSEPGCAIPRRGGNGQCDRTGEGFAQENIRLLRWECRAGDVLAGHVLVRAGSLPRIAHDKGPDLGAQGFDEGLEQHPGAIQPGQ